MKGIEEVTRNLRKEIASIENRSMAGLIEAVAFIRRDMDKTPPLIPLDAGILRNSWTVQPAKDQRVVRFGFTAEYAIDVHFKTGNVNWNRPNSGPFFFSNALSRNHANILEIIRKRAQLK